MREKVRVGTIVLILVTVVLFILSITTNQVSTWVVFGFSVASAGFVIGWDFSEGFLDG